MGNALIAGKKRRIEARHLQHGRHSHIAEVAASAASEAAASPPSVLVCSSAHSGGPHATGSMLFFSVAVDCHGGALALFFSP